MSLLQVTDKGLYCAAGDFYVDPCRGVERAIVTHAHSDHARPGSKLYLAADRGGHVLRHRLGPNVQIQLARFGERIDLNGVCVSLHPAGHLLGAAQVRIEYRGEVWVASGDYKTEADPTCDALEPVRCHTFITESTFGIPRFRWPAAETIFAEINDWWRANQAERKSSVLLAYPLGKAQRLLAGVNPAIGPIFVHPQVARFNAAYKAVGVRLPSCQQPGPRSTHAGHGRALVIVSPGSSGTEWLRKFGACSTAMVSGWMQVRRPNPMNGVDRGFVLSDHADFEGLIATIRATEAERIWVTHGYTAELSQWLRDRGWLARAIPMRSPFGAKLPPTDDLHVQKPLFDFAVRSDCESEDAEVVES